MALRIPVLLVLITLLAADAAHVSADEPSSGVFELSSLVLVGLNEEAVQTAIRVPSVGRSLGFLEHCELVEGEILLKESGAGGMTVGSAVFTLSPGDVFIHRETVHRDHEPAATASTTALGTYLDILIVVDERSRAMCLEGAIDLLDAQGEVRHTGNKRKTLKAVDL
jgi:hypothetical protein